MGSIIRLKEALELVSDGATISTLKRRGGIEYWISHNRVGDEKISCTAIKGLLKRGYVFI